MPSLRSYVFRAVTKVFSARINSISSIPKLRAFAGMFAGAGSKKPWLPCGATLYSTSADGISAEWIIPPQVSSRSVILYLHGGGWTAGWYNSHRWLVAHIGQAAKSRALAVDYRLAPEEPFPAALEDCLAVYRWLLKDGTPPEQIVMAGDSAGGNLVLTTLMALRDAGDPLPAAAVCISPMTDLAGTGESFSGNKDALLTAKFALLMARHYYGNQDSRLPLISPHNGNLTGLPPLLIQVGEDEILLSDAKRLADNARTVGVTVRLVVWPKMWHFWHGYVPYLPEARQAVEAIGKFVCEHVVYART